MKDAMFRGFLPATNALTQDTDQLSIDLDGKTVKGHWVYWSQYGRLSATQHGKLISGAVGFTDWVFELFTVSSTEGQWIGLLDKAGNYIFEDDIVKTKTGRLCVVYRLSSPCFCGWDLRPIETVASTFQTAAPPTHDLYLAENLEVVGNIHTNPELLHSSSECSRLQLSAEHKKPS